MSFQHRINILLTKKVYKISAGPRTLCGHRSLKYVEMSPYIEILLWFYSNIDRHIIYLRNKSWNPECVLSFNMDWRIKFTNIRQPMLKLETHSSFHELFRF